MSFPGGWAVCSKGHWGFKLNLDPAFETRVIGYKFTPKYSDQLNRLIPLILFFPQIEEWNPQSKGPSGHLYGNEGSESAYNSSNLAYLWR